MSGLSIEPYVRRLRLWWLGFGLLACLSGLYWLVQGFVGAGFGHYHQQSIVMVERQVCLFALLLLTSYSERNSAWWLAIGIISWKLWRLWVYYFALNWMLRSTSYYSEFLYGFRLLPNGLDSIISSLVDGVNPLSVAIYSWLYGYWLLLCLRVLRHLQSNHSLK